MSATPKTRKERQQGDGRSEGEKAEQAQEKHDAAKDRMTGIEGMDTPPANLEDWPDDQAKYLTYGGSEGGDHSYGEGPESKLGPSGLERRADGTILIDGEKVDNPDDYKGEPIPGGPTDPNSAELPGELKKRQKAEARDGS